MTPNDWLKYHCLYRWLEKHVADGPERNPLLNKEVVQKRHEIRMGEAGVQLVAMRGAQ